MRSSDCQPWWSDRSGLPRKSPWSARVSYTTLRDMTLVLVADFSATRMASTPAVPEVRGALMAYVATSTLIRFWGPEALT